MSRFFLVLPLFITALLWTTTNAAPQIQVFIRVNEVGYRPTEVKTAIVLGRETLPTEFRVLNTITGSVAFTGKAVPVPGRWGDFTHHAELNFTSLVTEGRYVIELGSSRSPQFAIGKLVNTDLADQLLDFMRLQRCGYNPYVDAVLS